MKNILKIIPTTDIINKDITSASLCIPDWYKNVDQYTSDKTVLRLDMPFNTNGTFKICSPLLDSLTSGYVFVLNADIEVYTNDDNFPSMMWRTDDKLVDLQLGSSWQGFNISDEYEQIIFKWGSTLGLQTPPGYSILFSHPYNRTDLPFYTLGGVVDTDKYNIPVNFPFLLKKSFRGIIEKGTPLVQILPFKREDWTHQYEEYDHKRVLERHNTFIQKIVRSYKKQYWSKKRYS
jgi:hypothetical protein